MSESGPLLEASSEAYALRLLDITKRFGATTALDHASLAVRQGSTHGVIGENGAGKSTLVKIVSGILQPDEGVIELFGAPTKLTSPAVAARLAVSTAFQEMSLLPDLTVAQNLFLGPGRGSPRALMDKSGLRGRASQLLADLAITGVDPDWLVADLALREQQMIEIAKAIRTRPRLLFLDESTSTLDEGAMHWFYGLVERLKAAGTTIVFITHRLIEIRTICDEITILRNGRAVGTYGINDLSEAEIIRLMIGGSLSTTFPPRREPPQTDPAIEVRGLTREPGLKGVSLSIGKGEILGVAGLDGQGQRELFQALYGTLHPDEGEIILAGRPAHIRSPRQAIREGISLVPEDRKTEGLLLKLPVRPNMSISALGRFATFGWINATRERLAENATSKDINLNARMLDREVTALSGGNQQKVVLGKALLTRSRCLLLYDPTRGVDVGAKAEIYRIMRSLAEAGLAVLFYSSELPELLNLADRIIVFYRGQIVAEFSGTQATEEAVMAAAIGHEGVERDH